MSEALEVDGRYVGNSSSAFALSSIVLLTCSAVLVLIFRDLAHWFMVPVTLCGALVGIDVAEWTRGRLGALEPRALVSLFGLHFFYLAPILHVLWDFWPAYVPAAQDWKESLGTVAVVNALGLVLYRFVLSLGKDRSRGVPSDRLLDEKRFRTLMHCAIILSLVAFAVHLLRFGGLLPYLSAVTDRGSRSALAGSGWLLILAEAWPLLGFVLIAVRHRTFLRENLAVLCLLILAFTVVQFGVGGLRGSRANTVWPLLIALGIVHVVVRPITRLMIALGVLGMVLFAWIYGLYKAVGLEVTGVVSRSTNVTQLSKEVGRSLDAVLLGDFGRSGMQALVADRIERSGAAVLAWGETYLGDLALLFPFPGGGTGRFEDKVAVGTNLLYGAGTYESGFQSTRIYGLVGEAMMNFGLAGGVLVFAVFGLAVRCATRVYIAGTPTLSGASILGPVLAAMCILALVSDLDNVIWFGVKHVMPLAAVVTFCVSGQPRNAPRRGTKAASRGFKLSPSSQRHESAASHPRSFRSR